jgi:hypothetical protein
VFVPLPTVNALIDHKIDHKQMLVWLGEDFPLTRQDLFDKGNKMIYLVRGQKTEGEAQRALLLSFFCNALLNPACKILFHTSTPLLTDQPPLQWLGGTRWMTGHASSCGPAHK